VTLLDVAHSRMPEGIPPESLPATCVALVKMLRKADAATLSMRGSNLAVHTKQLAQWLQRAGCPAQEATEEDLSKQECVLLEALEWQINLPSIESWMSMFCTRFNVLTRGLFVPSLNWVWEQGIFYARMVVMQRATSKELPPRRQAIGLLSLSFASARLLELEALRPHKLCSTMWEQLFVQSQLQGSVPPCVLRPGHARRVLELLQVTMDTNLVDLQEDCERVAVLLRDALTTFRHMQQAQSGSQAQTASQVHHTRV